MLEFGGLFQKYTNYVDMYNMLLWGTSNGRAVVSEVVNKGIYLIKYTIFKNPLFDLILVEASNFAYDIFLNIKK